MGKRCKKICTSADERTNFNIQFLFAFSEVSIKVHWSLKGLMNIAKWLTSLKLVNVPIFPTSLLCDSYASAVGRKHIWGIYRNSISHYRDFEMDLFKMATKKKKGEERFVNQGNYQWFLFYNHWIRFWPKKFITDKHGLNICPTRCESEHQISFWKNFLL